jgi:hypothetical protein
VDIESVFETEPRGGEHPFPAYRVHFFERFGPGASAGASFCFILRDVHNVHQVFAWAEASARGRTYKVFAVDESQDPQAWLQLSGDDPNQPDDPRRLPPPELADPGEVEIAEREDFEHKWRPDRRRAR